MADTDTSVRIKEDTWHRLNRYKGPGVSFDDVINTMLDHYEEDHEPGNSNRRQVMAAATAD